MFPRFSGRVWLATFLTALIAAAVSVSIAWAFANATAEAQAERELRRILDTLTPSIEQTLASADSTTAIRSGELFNALLAPISTKTSIRYTVILPDGTVVGETHEPIAQLSNHSNRPEVQDAAKNGRGRSIRRSDSIQIDMLYVAARLGPQSLNNGMGHGVLRVAMPTNEVYASASKLKYRLAIGLFLAICVAAGLSVVAMNILMRPIRRLTSAASQVAGELATQSMDGSQEDELEILERSIDRIGGRLTARARSVEGLRERDLAILASMRDGVIAVNKSQEVVHINRAAESLLKMKHGTANGRLLHEVIRVPGILQAIQGAVDGHDVPAADFHIHQGHLERIVELQGSTLQDTGGETIGAVVVLRDVSELRKLESIRRDFVANVSHELKTPLTAIRSLTETLLDDDDAPIELRRRFLAKIDAQSARLSTLVVDLLTLSRLEQSAPSPQTDPIDLCQSASEATRLLAPSASTKRIDVLLSLPATPVIISADEESLRQLFGNLLDNAIKYTPEGGKVSLTLSIDQAFAVIQVKDTGIGIEASQIERIFERFYRVDKARSREVGGTGLGLSIVKHIVHVLGGAIDVKSVPGHGTTFTVRLPLYVPGRAESSRRMAASTAPKHTS